MDYKNVKNWLEHIIGELSDLLNAATDAEEECLIQKSKKNEKMIESGKCVFRALHATQKYGCLGIKGEAECLECPFRR